MRRDALCAGVDVGNEVCSGVATDGVLEEASQAQHKSNGTHLLTTHPSLPYPHHPCTHHFHTLNTHSNPTYPLLPRPITTRATHTYLITHSPSLPYLHHPFKIITPHPHLYTSLCCFANHTLTTHLLYPSLQHPHHPA